MSYNSVEDYVKNAENNRNTAVLNSLLESEPGMKELPEITPEDEGKILQVNNGKPSWGSGSSGGGVLVVHDVDGTLDKTWQEIHDSTAPVLIHLGTGWFPVIQAEQDFVLGTYSVGVIASGNDGVTTMFYDATSPNGYPSYTAGPA